MKYIVCVATPSRFAQAEVLRQSCEEHMPEHQFKLVEIKEIPTESIYKTVSKTRIETCLELFDAGAEEVIHMGADWLFCDPIDFLDDFEYGQLDAIFMPHVLSELPDLAMPMVRAGVINSDFQIWRNTHPAATFLERMLKEVQNLESKNIFEYEQHWLPFALTILRAQMIPFWHYGVSYYNLHEREINALTALFHFSGFDVNNTKLSIHQPPDMRELNAYEKEFVESYRKKVLACAR